MPSPDIPFKVNQRVSQFATVFYVLWFTIILGYLAVGVGVLANLNSSKASKFNKFGGAIQKYPFVNKYLFAPTKDSAESGLDLFFGQVLSINDCKTAEYNNLETLYRCAKIDEREQLSITLSAHNLNSLITTTFALKKVSEPSEFQFNVLKVSLNSLFVLSSLILSLLLFIKTRHYLSGYLISLYLLSNATQNYFFYCGTLIFHQEFILYFQFFLVTISGSLGVYFFPNPVRSGFWRKPSFLITIALVFLMFITFFYINITTYLLSVSLLLVAFVVQYIFKYRAVLDTKEQKQVVAILLSISIGLCCYFPLNYFGGDIARLIGANILSNSIGIGVLFALLRYGLWQVESIVSKSATFSLLSIVAFSAWAGLDQGLQALLSQTLGLDNKSFAAFLAAAITSMFAVPVYRYLAKSCDAFFNKELYQLKRLLEKEMFVFADIQNLDLFVKQLGAKLCKLTGAQKITINFQDNRRQTHIGESFTTNPDLCVDESLVNNEHFSYQIDNTLMVSLELEYVDRKINHQIRQQLEDNIDDLARALASCARWNYFENLHAKALPVQA